MVHLYNQLLCHFKKKCILVLIPLRYIKEGKKSVKGGDEKGGHTLICLYMHKITKIHKKWVTLIAWPEREDKEKYGGELMGWMSTVGKTFPRLLPYTTLLGTIYIVVWSYYLESTSYIEYSVNAALCKYSVRWSCYIYTFRLLRF